MTEKPRFNKGPNAEVVANKSVFTFVASFPGECEECCGDIEPGDDIARHPDGGYAHGECLED